MRNKLFLSVVLLLGSLALSGCEEKFGATVYEAGKYQGPADELLEKGSQVASLEDRLKSQMDR